MNVYVMLLLLLHILNTDTHTRQADRNIMRKKKFLFLISF